jgi:outer membrane lipoprotein SlyB
MKGETSPARPRWHLNAVNAVLGVSTGAAFGSVLASVGVAFAGTAGAWIAGPLIGGIVGAVIGTALSGLLKSDDSGKPINGAAEEASEKSGRTPH